MRNKQVTVMAVFTCAILLTLGSGSGRAAPAKAAPDAVVAIIDTGINPYHITFRDDSPRAYKHPSTYLPGYPKDAIALPISLGEKNYWTAVRQDCDKIWSNIERGKLYWFPGTKIVGAINLDPGFLAFQPTPMDCNNPQSVSNPGMILDAYGHGTMTASRAASAGYGACPHCRIVAVQGFSAESVEWPAAHASWIDAQSNSWGPLLPVWEPTSRLPLVSNNPELVRAIEDSAQKHLAFWASGNGALTRGGVIGHPTIIDPRMTPSIVMVGGHDSGYVNTWPDFPPHVVSDSCDSWAAYHQEVERSGEDVGGGTSGASPYAAGGALRYLLEARRILGDRDTGVEDGVVARGRAGVVPDGPLADGKLTLQEWKELTFATATRRPAGQHEDGPPCDAFSAGGPPYIPTPIKWKQVPDGYPEYIHIGYGAVDDPARSLAFKVLRGLEPMPDRTATDTYFALDGVARSALHQVYRSP